MDAASLHFFMECGVPPWRELKKTTGIIGTPLLEIHTRFMRPATYGETLHVHTSIESWRAKTFVQKHVVMRGDTVLCEGRETRAFVHPPRGRAGPHQGDPGARGHQGPVQLTLSPCSLRVPSTHPLQETSMNFKKTLLALAITATAGTAALADVKIGVSLSLTGPGSGLGIPMQNQLTLFPKTIAGEKVELIILDDASDPGKGCRQCTPLRDRRQGRRHLWLKPDTDLGSDHAHRN